ncbi:MAG: PepSY domain-containing protein [Muribaculaceae bacterium]|nr:PepSY domain-containing protein [Muribaculaceae bacterium]
MKSKTSRRLHLWFSVPVGLIITLICLSGAVLVFERDLGTRHQSSVQPLGTPALPLSVILEAARASAPEGVDITGVTVYPDPEKAYKVSLSKPPMAAIWVNQYTGEVIGNYSRAGIFKLASSAHRRIFDKSKTAGNTRGTGRLIVGISTLALLVILITGLILWWPRDRAKLRKRFSMPLHKGPKAFWHAVHVNLGFFITAILLVCAVTGLTYSFPWFRSGFYSTFGAELPKSSRNTAKAENLTAWDSAFAVVSAQNSGKEIRFYQGKADVVLGGWGNQQATDTYRFDTETGTITDLTPYATKDRATKIKGWIYSLHSGAWGGLFSKILYCLAMIIGASLPLTGYYLWVVRLRKKKHRTDAKTTV